tara:strand:+ start:391 stop:522 length:132 start_codon:yes stop_codon:yes gene_type:complete
MNDYDQDRMGPGQANGGCNVACLILLAGYGIGLAILYMITKAL